ncbi:MAG: hypothetical protein OXC62_03725 [Aestuariivita sp.]|nr:hypothetical protein [Aestuariivita sp.]
MTITVSSEELGDTGSDCPVPRTDHQASAALRQEIDCPPMQ